MATIPNSKILCSIILFALLLVSPVYAKTHHRTFVIKEASYTRLCETKNILTVNGQFPGPTIGVRKGDTIIVQVHNQGGSNVSIHWHGVNQPRNPWSDGPAYITQCPIKPGSSFTYKLELTEEEGTIWWHAHSDWDRATVHGAIVVHPKLGTTFPFPKPHKEIPIIIGEWWKGSVSQIIADAMRTGADPNISDAFTINGQPGDCYQCSKEGTFKTMVQKGKTYLLRVINAAMNNEIFFAIANHKLTVVGTDASYTKPFIVDYIMITPGQTIDLLLHADQCSANEHGCRYYMAAHSFSDGPGVPYDNTTTTAILEYNTYENFLPSSLPPPKFPFLPNFTDEQAASDFTSKLRSLASKDYPIDVPKKMDERIIMTVSVNEMECPNESCSGPNKTRLSASLNNISFVSPSISILQAYYQNIKGVYGIGFPSEPLFDFNFTSNDLPNSFLFTKKGTEVRMIEYGTVVEVVYQGTGLFRGETHPLHLHGYSFYVVGMGSGNFNKNIDPLSYNLVDPPYKNTVVVPKNGWVAIRFRATNPGVWFLHCHLERHSSWGMETVFIVKDGAKQEEKMLPPPLHMPQC